MLIITLTAGLFTLFGSLLVLVFNNNKKLVDFSISLGFGVLISLVLFELAPESIELVSNNVTKINGILLVIILMLGGLLSLKLLDLFIPEHDGKDNLNHIGIMTFITLFIHNVLEGMAIYSVLNANMRMGILLSLGVALHNIPLGMAIASFFYKDKSNKKTIVISTITSLSTLIGGVIIWIFKGSLLNDLTLGVILSITLGMLVYIVLFELLPQVMKNKSKKSNILGIIIGILILIVSLLIE